MITKYKDIGIKNPTFSMKLTFIQMIYQSYCLGAKYCDLPEYCPMPTHILKYKVCILISDN